MERMLIMENKVNKLLKTLDNSTGYWMTDNHNINTDNTMYCQEDNALHIVDCESDEEIHTKFSDIIDIVIKQIDDMIESVIKFANRPALIIFSFMN